MPADPTASLSPAQRRSLDTVLALLAEERASVSSVTDQRAWKVHVEESLTLPEALVDLIDSISRKTAFIAHAAAEASIPNATALTTRAEDLARTEARESYDVVTARAVGRLSTLAELASPLLKEGGVLIAWKGKRDEEEEQQMSRAAEQLAMRPAQILDVGPRAGSEHRPLHVLRKSGPTPADLPRRPGMAKKRPR